MGQGADRQPRATRTTKVQDLGEIRRWIEEEMPYPWMVEQYREKYNIETTPTMFSNVRRRLGIEPWKVHNPDLIPWSPIKDEHRWLAPIVHLRNEARRRAGKPIDPDDERRLDDFIASLKERNAVVHYDADTEQGWFLVERREGIDRDLVRDPRDGRKRAARES